MRFFEKTLFFLLLISIPIQLGKHFWPVFAFVQGIRVDYLSPTIYLSDIILVTLIVVSLPRLYKGLVAVGRNYLVLVIGMTLALSTLFAADMQAAIFGDIKFFEFFYLGFYVSQTFETLKNRNLYVFAIILGALTESVIVLLQFFSQRSLGGPFYFLGERTFTGSTPGIAVFQTNGQLLLRPYGTFPHPNLVAFYLLFAFVFLLFINFGRSRFYLLVKIIALTIVSCGIILTFSRIIIILWMFLLTFHLLSHKKLLKRSLFTTLAVVFCLATTVLLLLLLQRFETSIVKDTLLRLDLMKISYLIFIEHPVIGVGLNNFFLHEIALQKNLTPTLLQPVHNIYLLWVTQTGMLGLFALGGVLMQTEKKIYLMWQQRLYGPFINNTTIVLAITVLVSGFFDHYLLTLQQGQLLFAIVLGLIFSKKKIKGVELG